jgi:hypothetical protein
MWPLTGFDGIAAFELAFDGWRDDDAPCVADIDLGPIAMLHAMAAIAEVDIGAGNGLAGDAP